MMKLGNPEALWGLAVAVPLVWLHLRPKRRSARTVPALFLWSRVPEGSRRHAFRWPLERPLSLGMCLLVVGLLAVALSEPRFETPGDPPTDFYLVLDGSIRMLGRTDRDLPGFQAAAEKALGYVSAMGAEDRAAILAAESSPRMLCPLTGDRILLGKTLGEYRPSWAKASLEQAVRWIRSLSSERPRRVVVLSDQPALPVQSEGEGSEVEGRLQGLSLTNLGPREVERVSVGTLPGEIVLGETEVKRELGSPRFSYRTAVQNRSARGQQLRLRAVFQSEPLSTLEFDAPPGAVTWREVEIEQPEGGTLLVELLSDDAFQEDDRHYRVVPPQIRFRVIVVCDEPVRPALEALLGSFPLAIDREGSFSMSAEDFVQEPPSLGPVDLVILDGGSVERALPEGNYLILGTGGSHLPVRRQDRLRQPKVTVKPCREELGKIEMNPELWREFQVSQGWLVAADSDDQILLESPLGPLALGRSDSRNNIVYFGFSLEESNLALLGAFPVLFRGILRWIAFQRGFLPREDFTVGRSLLWSEQALPAAEARIEGLDARGVFGVWSWSREESRGMFSWTRRPGWYRAQGYEARTTCAVNVETPTPMQAPSTQPPYEPLPPAPRRSPRLYDLAPICLAVALAGLFSEWLLYRMGLT